MSIMNCHICSCPPYSALPSLSPDQHHHHRHLGPLFSHISHQPARGEIKNNSTFISPTKEQRQNSRFQILIYPPLELHQRNVPNFITFRTIYLCDGKSVTRKIIIFALNKNNECLLYAP